MSAGDAIRISDTVGTSDTLPWRSRSGWLRPRRPACFYGRRASGINAANDRCKWGGYVRMNDEFTSHYAEKGVYSRNGEPSTTFCRSDYYSTERRKLNGAKYDSRETKNLRTFTLRASDNCHLPSPISNIVYELFKNVSVVKSYRGIILEFQIVARPCA